MPLEVQGYTAPHWKALRYGKDGSSELSFGSTSSVCQGILKSDNLLLKQGFVKTQSLRIVKDTKCIKHDKFTYILLIIDRMEEKKQMEAMGLPTTFTQNGSYYPYQRDFFCYTCHVQMTSEEAFETHLKALKHGKMKA